MKKIILAMTAVCMMTMVSCGGHGNSVEPQPQKAPLNQYDSASVYHYNENGKCIQSYTCYYTYDEAGNQTEALENKWKTVRVYDARRNKTEEAIYEKKTENMYTTYEGEWIPFQKDEYRYNDKNQMVHMDHYLGSGELDMYEDYTYSSDGRSSIVTRSRILYATKDRKDTAVSYIEMTTDEHGNILDYYMYYYSGQDKVEICSGRMEYTYDQHGNVTMMHEARLYGGETREDVQIEYTYTYDPAGNMMEKIMNYQSDYHSSIFPSSYQCTEKYVYHY